ncbi:hypothetical protein Ac2012v2_002878 [Leucoagaricus gongylophorus]
MLKITKWNSNQQADIYHEASIETNTNKNRPACSYLRRTISHLRATNVENEILVILEIVHHTPKLPKYSIDVVCKASVAKAFPLVCNLEWACNCLRLTIPPNDSIAVPFEDMDIIFTNE